MELECVKFKEKMMSEDAQCRHPNDYCRYRSSCIIHYMEKETLSEKEKDEEKK